MTAQVMPDRVGRWDEGQKPGVEKRNWEKDEHPQKRQSPVATGRVLPMSSPLDQEAAVSAQDQNPDLLHWRANVLLDEMMLGAVDIAADESTRPRLAPTPPQQRPPAAEPLAPTAEPRAVDDGDPYQWAERRAAAYVANTGHPRGYDEADSSQAPRAAHERAAPAAVPSRGTPEPKPPGNGTEQWLFAAEQRYQQLAVRRQAASTANATYEYDGWSAAPDYGLETHEASLSAVVPKYPAPAEAPMSARATAQPVVAKNPTRGKRSNLLPRMSAADVHSIQQEMGMLQSAIEEVLPAGHESRERSQHLLQKAHAILQQDATRSAEVDYYLQQVRTIVQRVQETAHWSNLYRSRLQTYLWGWLVLSTLVILGRYLYQGALMDWLGGATATGDASLYAYNLLTAISAFFAGAFGGAAGVLLNLYSHANLEHGFFDRKYGLRGLILPLIGAGVGLLLCLVFGLLYYVLGIEPADYLLLGLLPALLALVFGFVQEYLYGVRS